MSHPTSLLLVKDDQGKWGLPAERSKPRETYFSMFERSLIEETSLLGGLIIEVSGSVQFLKKDTNISKGRVVIGRIVAAQQRMYLSETIWPVSDPDREITEAGIIALPDLKKILLANEIRVPKYNRRIMLAFALSALSMAVSEEELKIFLTELSQPRIQLDPIELEALKFLGPRLFWPNNNDAKIIPENLLILGENLTVSQS